MTNFAHLEGFTTAADGLKFPASQVASGDANTLDDYEEAPWTPTLKFGGANVGMVGTFVGTSTKIGNRVFGEATISLSAKGTSTGNATVEGLPVAAGQDVVVQVLMGGVVAGITSPVQGLLGATTTAVQPFFQSATGLTPLTHSNFTNTTTIRVSFSYPV